MEFLISPVTLAFYFREICTNVNFRAHLYIGFISNVQKVAIDIMLGSKVIQGQRSRKLISIGRTIITVIMKVVYSKLQELYKIAFPNVYPTRFVSNFVKKWVLNFKPI